MATLINDQEHMTAAEAATELGTTITRVLMLLKHHALEGRLLDGEWYVASDSVACGKAHGRDLKTVTGCVSHCTANGCGCK
jgi:hypothetical protein